MCEQDSQVLILYLPCYTPFPPTRCETSWTWLVGFLKFCHTFSCFWLPKLYLKQPPFLPYFPMASLSLIFFIIVIPIQDFIFYLCSLLESKYYESRYLIRQVYCLILGQNRRVLGTSKQMLLLNRSVSKTGFLFQHSKCCFTDLLFLEVLLFS